MDGARRRQGCAPSLAWGALPLVLIAGAFAAPAAAQEHARIRDGAECTPCRFELEGARPDGWEPPPVCREEEGDAREGQPAATPPEATPEASERPPPAVSENGHGRGAAESRSIGFTDEGRLVGGVRLEESRHVRYVPSEVRGRNGGRFWGTEELVSMVERVAAKMAERFAGTRLSVGELSAREGGEIPGHRSHQAGRDVDFAFYLTDGDGRRVEPDELVRIGEQGVSARRRGGRLSFDAEASWALVRNLLSDPHANVQFIFVAEHLQWLLLDQAEEERTPHELLQRARQVFRQPEHHAHDNHFHVRLFCDPGDRPRCADDAQYRPPYGHRRRPRGTFARARGRVRQLGLGTERAAVRALRRAPPRGWREAVPGRPPSYLAWPVTRGHFNRGFGYTRADQPDVPHHGVDVGAPEGSVVRASAPGLVVFSGRFRSFGNAVFLVHKNGWVTIYAHNLRNTVRPGEVVGRNHPIALLGSTGVSRAPHLHYELREAGQPQDPEARLRGIRRWTDTHGPPERLVTTRPSEDAEDTGNVETRNDDAGDGDVEDGEEGNELPVRLPRRIPREAVD